MVSIAYVNQNLREFRVTEFVDNKVLSNLESAIVQIGPKGILIKIFKTIIECLIVNDKEKNPQLEDVLKRNELVITERSKKEFTAKNIEENLKELLNDFNKSLDQIEFKNAMCCLNSIISFLKVKFILIKKKVNKR
jgi:hypothetical protein